MKVDPVHFFNARGVSTLTQDYQVERIAELEAENAHLKRNLKAAAVRLLEISRAAEAEKAH